MKIYIIDDERLAREELKNMLNNDPAYIVVGEATNAMQALKEIPELEPDVLLLDINMPEKSGFDLLEELDKVPEVIFTTAYDEYALKAFEVNAFDYLLKPIQADRLRKSLDKIKSRNDPENRNTNPTEVLTQDRQIFIKDGDKCYFVKLADVFLIRSIGAYAKIYFGAHAPLIHRSMNALEERLDPLTFFRANRKEIINLRYVEKIDSYFKGGMQVILKNGDPIEISTRRSVRFKEMMSL